MNAFGSSRTEGVCHMGLEFRTEKKMDRHLSLWLCRARHRQKDYYDSIDQNIPTRFFMLGKHEAFGSSLAFPFLILCFISYF